MSSCWMMKVKWKVEERLPCCLREKENDFKNKTLVCFCSHQGFSFTLKWIKREKNNCRGGRVRRCKITGGWSIKIKISAKKQLHEKYKVILSKEKQETKKYELSRKCETQNEGVMFKKKEKKIRVRRRKWVRRICERIQRKEKWNKMDKKRRESENLRKWKDKKN